MKFFSALLFFLAAFAAGEAAVIYLPREPDAAERRGAEELARYWEKMTGEAAAIRLEERRTQARPRYYRFGSWRPVGEDRSHRREEVDLRQGGGTFHPPPYLGGYEFYVGNTRGARLHAPLPEGLDDHGFRLRRVGGRFFLRGRSPVASQFAVFRFLDRYGGVRWYLPTELGEHVPEFRGDLPRRIDEVGAPDFVSRRWGSATLSKTSFWETRNLVRERDRFHHNLSHLFTESVYELRPDFFILLGGERIRPEDALRGVNFQICFGNPDAAKFAARKAAEFFEANPGEASFSLGMNDTDAICRCPDCQRWVDPEKTFRGRPDYSDLVFIFMNRAAEELGKTHPDKYLGCLAYHWAENVPSFPVHPKVMPYLTADRGQWHNDDFRREDRDLMSRWAEAGPERIGLYDYYYGSSFVIPRLFTAVSKESLQHASEVGIDGFYAEIYSIWSLDGPKAWIASRLLWDVTADRDALMNEFCRNLFAEAAEPMRSFFEGCESIWMNQGEPVFWLKFYHDFTQLELFPPEICRQLRRHLEEAEGLAATDLARERVKLFSEGFRLTELYSQLYHGIKEAIAEADRLAPESAGRDAFDVLVKLIQRSLAHREALERHYEEVTLPNDLHRPFRRIETRAGFLPGMKLSRLVADAVAQSGQDGDRTELERLVADVREVFPESGADLVLAHARRPSHQLLLNYDFEQDVSLFGDGAVTGGVDHTPFFWGRKTAAGTPTAFRLADAEAREGKFSLTAQGAVHEDLYQRFPVKPGQVYRFSAWCKGTVSPGSRVEITISWRDSDGGILSQDIQSMDRLLPGADENWRELLAFGVAPPGTVEAYAVLMIRNQGPDDVVYFDDISLRRFDP